MRLAAILLVAAGLAAGPGYFLYMKLFSGKLMASYSLKALGGVNAPREFEPVELELTPSLGPVRISTTVRATWKPATVEAEANHYRATVLRDGEVITQKDFDIVATSLDAHSQVYHVALLRLERPPGGSYRIELGETDVPELTVEEFSLKVYRNVREPDLRIVALGAVLALAGLGLLML